MTMKENGKNFGCSIDRWKMQFSSIKNGPFGPNIVVNLFASSSFISLIILSGNCLCVSSLKLASRLSTWAVSLYLRCAISVSCRVGSLFIFASEVILLTYFDASGIGCGCGSLPVGRGCLCLLSERTPCFQWAGDLRPRPLNGLLGESFFECPYDCSNSSVYSTLDSPSTLALPN